MSKPTVSTVLWVAFFCLLSMPTFGGESGMRISSTRVDWSPAADAERWILTVSGPDELFLRRQFEAGKAPYLSLFDSEGDRLPDGSYAWELRGLKEGEGGTQEKPTPPRGAGKSFKAPGEAQPVLTGRLAIRDGSFVATPPNAGAETPEPPVHEIAPKLQSSGPFANDGNACIGDECNGLTDAGFSALKLRSPEPDLLFDDVGLPCEEPSCPGPPHDWAVQINQSATNQFAVSEFVDDPVTSIPALSSTPLTLRGGAPDNSIFVDSIGHVGLGTASPAEKLHLFENVDANTILTVENPNTGLSALGAIRAKSDSAIVNFQAHGSGRTLSRFGQTLASWAEFLQVSGNGFIIGTLADKPLILGTNNTNRLHITAAGNVGIGTSSPTKKLTVQAAAGNDDVVQVLKSSGSTAIFRIFETTAGDGLLSLFDNAGTEAARFTSVSGGKLALGCNAPEHRLDLGSSAGTACSSSGSRSFIDAGSTTFTASSSRSLKENLVAVEVTDILDKISQVAVYNYDFIEGPKDKLGLMAEDFHAIFGRGSDKLLNGQEVEMALWLAVQELTDQNKKLAAQNKEIAERLVQLEAVLAAERGETP